MSKNNSKRDPVELFMKDIKELSSAFTTSLDSFFDDMSTGVDRIFSSENKNHSETKKNSKQNKKWYIVT